MTAEKRTAKPPACDPVAEVPLRYSATVDIARDHPEEIAAGYVNQFADRCIAALGLDPNRAAPKAVRAVVQELPQEPADWTRRFVFSAKNVPTSGEITVALVRLNSNCVDRRLVTRYPGDVMRVVTQTGGLDGETETREFCRTGIDLATGDHVYREQPETNLTREKERTMTNTWTCPEEPPVETVRYVVDGEDKHRTFRRREDGKWHADHDAELVCTWAVMVAGTAMAGGTLEWGSKD